MVTNYDWLLSSSILVSSREVEAPSIVVGAALGGIFIVLSTVTVVVNVLQSLIGVLRWTYKWARYINRYNTTITIECCPID